MTSDEIRQIKMKSFATRLSYSLDKSGMSQRKLSEITGITEVSISRYMNGKRLPHPIVLEKICTALNCDVDWLIGREKTGGKSTIELDVIHRDKKSRPFDGTCDTCKYFDDPHEVCQARLCVHAISALYECYVYDEDRGYNHG